MIAITSPDRASIAPGVPTVFLAGSIEMGAAQEWQQRVIDSLSDLGVAVFNPRRADWDSTWKQTRDDPNFVGQVNWEVDHIDAADFVFIYIDPNTKSIVSFGEYYYLLGQIVAGRERTVIICCPQGFWRRGNLEVMSDRCSIYLHEDLESAVKLLRGFITLKISGLGE